ncbi:nucleolar protein 12 [Stemphylium lycopersici]|uniref:Nucleolar protein 12 n=1 Tax=Stemphylium lycopersici TaxID=183478 RepID=A0A364NF66_STELY|nr:nucleolar protein 12 [Stemphylium lycopersici]RAR15753.1 nucleolar protein 12 [Stemphylium lycopersici]
MGKSKEKRAAKPEEPKEPRAPKKSPKADKSFIKVDKKAFDPTLASLFATSAGPVQAPPKSRYQARIQKQTADESSEDDQGGDANDAELSSASESLPSDDDEEQDEDDDDDGDDDDENMSDASDGDGAENEAVLAKLRESALNGSQEKQKKRKRGDKEEVEDAYMRKLAREEEKEEEQRQKKRKTKKAAEEAENESSEEDDDDKSSDEAEAEKSGSDSEEADEADEAEKAFAIPKHESLMEKTDESAAEVEKAARTVFLGNVSTDCINSKSAEKTLKKHLESFIPDLADNKPPHKIESIRFRSTAFGSSLPKRAAFAKKDIMDATTKSTNAYAVYSTKIAANNAVRRLNGSVLLNRHLHVDSVAHPAKIDHRRCVFVGNLPFVDDESQTPVPEGEKPKKKRPASDIEEGLWVHLAKCGTIESVRVVRDAKTRVGKGFAYVQFQDENGVEAALQLNEKMFPPMLPRKLRITRCKADKKKDKPRGPPPSKAPKTGTATGKAGYAPKLSEEQKSLQGRARSMLGKVAKAHTKEGFVFEGHRASERQGKSGLKFKGSGGKKKGPNGRKSRSAGWKKTGGKK